MKKIYLVRHGETNHNVNGIVQGADSILSEKGEQQAKVLASRLEHLDFDTLLVSDYTRTRQTVEPLLEKISITPEFTPLLRETKQPSTLVNTPNTSEAFLNFYQAATEHISDPLWRYSDEETFYEVIERAKRFISYAESKSGDIVAITHGRFIVYVVMYILTEGKLNYETWLLTRHGFQTTNTGVTVLGYNEKFSSWRLLTFNDQAHFAE